MEMGEVRGGELTSPKRGSETSSEAFEGGGEPRMTRDSSARLVSLCKGFPYYENPALGHLR